LEYKRIKTKNNNDAIYRLCKKHGGRLIKRETICSECGAKIEFGISGVTPIMCKKCRAKATKERMKIVQRLRRNAVKIEYFPDPGCINFKELCGGCIKPIFPCKIFKEVV